MTRGYYLQVIMNGVIYLSLPLRVTNIRDARDRAEKYISTCIFPKRCQIRIVYAALDVTGVPIDPFSAWSRHKKGAAFVWRRVDIE